MNHTLTIVEDTAEAARIRADGGGQGEVRSDAWTWAITCPYLPSDRFRPCRAWRECCSLSAAERDALDEAADGPCPESPSGRHEKVDGELGVGYPTGECYLRVGEDMADQARELCDRLAPGAYPVDLAWDGYGDLRVVAVGVTGFGGAGTEGDHA